jgi:hypothetical protein
MTSRTGSPARWAARAASSCSTLTGPALTFTRTGGPAKVGDGAEDHRLGAEDAHGYAACAFVLQAAEQAL